MSNHNSTMNKRPPEAGSHGDRLILWLAFVVIVPIALFGQLLGLHWRNWLPGAEGAKSAFGGVKAAVYTFMSHIS
jgi:light-harvesting complex 1 beta chain